jgi:hypothetical protein
MVAWRDGSRTVPNILETITMLSHRHSGKYGRAVALATPTKVFYRLTSRACRYLQSFAYRYI